MAFQHDKLPKPAAGETNATRQIKHGGIMEDTFVPETHPGGLTYSDEGRPKNADGVFLDGGEQPVTVEELLNQLPPDHPLVAKQRAADAVKAGKSPMAASSSAPRRESGSTKAR